MKYKIVKGRKEAELESKVRDMLIKGWTLHGGASITCFLDERSGCLCTIYVQAMVLEEMDFDSSLKNEFK